MNASCVQLWFDKKKENQPFADFCWVYLSISMISNDSEVSDSSEESGSSNDNHSDRYIWDRI